MSGPIEPLDSSRALMGRAAAFIAAHYASDLRMADLARHCHISVRSLQNLFQAECGEPPLRALRRHRLVQLHRAVEARPWAPLRSLYASCGLGGSLADRDLFLQMYGITLKEHQHCCRQKSSPALAPALSLVRSPVEAYLEGVA
jgi:hypothetical protein